MKEAKITVINLEKQQFSNEKTGEVRLMTKVNYAIKMANTSRTKGCAILTAYCDGEAFNTLEKYLMVPNTLAEIREEPTERGSKYVLTSVDKNVVKE